MSRSRRPESCKQEARLLAARFPPYLNLNPLAIPVAELPLFAWLTQDPKRARRPPAEPFERMLLDGHELLVREHLMETSGAAEDPRLSLTLDDVALHLQSPVASNGVDRRLVLLINVPPASAARDPQAHARLQQSLGSGAVTWLSFR